MSNGAYLLINVASNTEKQVVKDLMNVEGIKSAHIVTGLHDIIAYVETDDMGELRKVLLEEIREIAGITKTVTCITFDVKE
jgi:DNA-binding Lrp family transcriptional regulator